MPIKKNSK